MERNCWEKFLATGKIEDYLSYKMKFGTSERDPEKGRTKEETGAGKSESNCFNRDGAFYGADWRI